MARRFDGPEARAPKPFDYIAFADAVVKTAPAGHHRYDPALVTGTLEGVISVLTPLHVASGAIELTRRVAPQFVPTSPLIHAFVRCGGRRVIPGSTLKGAVRSVVEAITPSTAGKVGRRTQVPEALREPRQAVKKGRPPSDSPLTLADRLFGVMDYLAQVHFADARQDGDEVELVQIPSLFAPRGRGPARGRKFYRHGTPAEGNRPVEAVPEGGRFALRCAFENLASAELGVLLIALGQDEHRLHLKLGGGKPACYGSVAIELTGLHVRDKVVEDYLAWDVEMQAVSPTAYVDAARADANLLLRSQLIDLETTLRYPNDRDCPGGQY